MTLPLVVLGPEVGSYVLGLTELPDAFLALWIILRWVPAFLAVTVAHVVLYYLAPNADLPFKWVTPGSLSATILMFISSAAALRGQFRTQRPNLRAARSSYSTAFIPVTMLWFYYTGLVLLIGAEINAVLSRIVEEREGVTFVRSEPASN